ncbi:MAG: hypothetical protein AAF600_00785 [Bacteroidota bacterium]
MNKGLARLIFLIVFLVPVGWYLFLQLFGDNNFSLKLKYPINECAEIAQVLIVKRPDSVSLAEKNYMDRVAYAAKERSVLFIEKDIDFFDCINQSSSDLVLTDENGLWGNYKLSREGVDLLLIELDILLLQKSYGKGTYR